MARFRFKLQEEYLELLPYYVKYPDAKPFWAAALACLLATAFFECRRPLLPKS